MYVTLRMQKTEKLVNSPIIYEILDLIGVRGTGKIQRGLYIQNRRIKARK